MQTNHVKLNNIKKSRTISVVVSTVAAAVAPPTEWKGRKTKKKKKEDQFCKKVIEMTMIYLVYLANSSHSVYYYRLHD